MMQFLVAFDHSQVVNFFAQRSITLTVWFIRVSELATTATIIGLTLALALLLSVRGRFSYIAGLLVSVGGGGLAGLALKQLIHRVRPDVMYWAYPENGYAFPSGHSTSAAMFYGYCIFLVWQFVPSRPWRIAATALLTLLILSIGFSRVYLGVHYPLDVLGGFALGGGFALLGAWTALYLERRRS